jgi:hypothetical protein
VSHSFVPSTEKQNEEAYTDVPRGKTASGSADHTMLPGLRAQSPVLQANPFLIKLKVQDKNLNITKDFYTNPGRIQRGQTRRVMIEREPLPLDRVLIFYFWGLHPVALITRTLLQWQSIATKFFLLLSHSIHSLHVSARAGQLQVNIISGNDNIHLKMARTG